MTTSQEFHTLIKRMAAKRLLFLPHAIRQMSRPDRMITAAEVWTVIRNFEVIED